MLVSPEHDDECRGSPSRSNYVCVSMGEHFFGGVALLETERPGAEAGCVDRQLNKRERRREIANEHRITQTTMKRVNS